MFTFTKLGHVGRIGNQMFQIAGTIGAAVKHSSQFSFPPWMNWDQWYPPAGATYIADRKQDIDLQKWFKKPLPVLEGEIQYNNEGIPIDYISRIYQFNNTGVGWGYNEVNLPDGNWNLEGHMQSEKYFLNAKETIREYFTFTDEKLAAFGGTGLQDNTCCILFRRGDYVQKNAYHPVIGPKFYERAMAEFPSDTKWIVFPEHNYQECRDIVGRNAVFVPDNLHPMDKIAIASKCRHFILPNSTFLWFPAWLGQHPEKKVISVSAADWFGPQAKAENVSADHIIPADWIQINAA